MNILFVCTGNICRSVLAQHLLRAEAAKRGLPWEVRSCGTAADPFLAVPEPVRGLLAETGIELHHQPRILSPELVKWADVILAMAADHLAAVRTGFPEAQHKAHLLRAYAGLDDEDIEDPYGGSEEDYREAAEAIRLGLDKILQKAAPSKKAARKTKSVRPKAKAAAGKKRAAKARR